MTADRVWVNGSSATASGCGATSTRASITIPHLRGNWHYHIVPVIRSVGESAVSDVVGPLCDTAHIFGRDGRLVTPGPGEVLALLDVGGYAESGASNFNTQPRPLSAMVRGTDAVVITERESVEALLSGQRMPAWLP